MAVGAGMEVGQHEAELAATTASQMAEALINLLRAIAGRRGIPYADDIDKGAKVITEHVQHGGELNHSTVPERDAAIFEQVLRENFIPYMQIQITGEGGVRQRMFFTRAGGKGAGLSDDRIRLEKAEQMFHMRMRVGLNELTPQEFVRLADHQEVTKTGGLSREEAELFN